MSRRPFLVPVAALLGHPGERRREVRRGVIPGLALTASAVPEGAEVEADVVLEPALPGILATGKVTAPWVGACRRCLEPARGQVQAEVRELFRAGGDPETTYPMSGERIDLEPLARDAVLLELPLAPLCQARCRGLCPSCGTDRNRGGCGCRLQPGDPRWAALDALRGLGSLGGS